MGVSTSDPLIPRYRGSDVLTLARLAEAGLLYVTTAQTRGQLMARLLSQEWSAKPEVVLAVIWAIQGQATGHEWQACTSCQEVQLARLGRHRCVMTPGCKGSLQRLAKRPRLTAALRRQLEGRRKSGGAPVSTLPQGSGLDA